MKRSTLADTPSKAKMFFVWNQRVLELDYDTQCIFRIMTGFRDWLLAIFVLGEERSTRALNKERLNLEFF